jgi:hypothetical protein
MHVVAPPLFMLTTLFPHGLQVSEALRLLLDAVRTLLLLQLLLLA